MHDDRTFGTRRPPQDEPAAGTPSIRACDGPGVLVVNDDVLMRLMLRAGLEQHGLPVWLAAGAGEAAESLTEADMHLAATLGDDITLARFVALMEARGGKAAGAVRVSFGIASNVSDALRFLHFVADLRDQTRLSLGAATFDIASCRVIRDGA